MRTYLACISVVVVLCLPFRSLHGQTNERAAEDGAIRASADAYRNAFNQGDANAIAALWTANGEYIDPSGLILRGRDTITRAFEGFFAENKGSKIEIETNSVSFLRDDLANETGSTTTTSSDGKKSIGQYSALHVKRGGKWLLLSVHEQPSLQGSHYEHLKELQWLIGHWVDDQESLVPKDAPTVQTRAYWSVNGNFIVREFTATVGGRVTNVGTQRIGWHAPTKEIRSWTFNSKGGIVISTWTKSEDQWMLSTHETLPSGEVVTSTESVTHDPDGSQNWSVTQRHSSGDALPDQVFRVTRLR